MKALLLAGLAATSGYAAAAVQEGAAVSPSMRDPLSSAVPQSVIPAQASANSNDTSRALTAQGFETFKVHLRQSARRAGVTERTIDASMPGLRLNQRAIELDRAQRPVVATSSNDPPRLAPYLSKHVTPSLISRGRARYYHQWPNLVRIHQRYGVDSAVIMAIYGKETSYGAVTGGFDLLEVLASLAYEGRRRQMFETEFVSALMLIDQGVPRTRLRGSYAGATGYPQFMPSVVLTRRADGDGDGQADIWANEADALASIANYLRGAGWRTGIPWGTAVRVPQTLNRASIRSLETPATCPAVFRRHSRELPVAKWRELGVQVSGPALPDNQLVRLFEPDGPTGSGYLLTANYRAILGYNCSNFYAMSVGLLADAIARR